jgi:exosortase/archaeosortase family protein
VRRLAFEYGQLPVRGVAVVVLAGTAFHYSLLSLLRELTVQTPLAYLGLVPFIALLLAWARIATDSSTSKLAPSLALDFPLGRLLGVLFLFVAFVVAVVVPTSVDHWLNRLDLLALPLFVAGLVTVFYGLRRLWLWRFPVAFLLLAWPLPYLPLAGDGLRWFTDVTIYGVVMLNTVIPLATTVGTDGVFEVAHAGSTFVLAVGSACAGVNGLVGFGLIGSATAYILRGPALRKMTWLAFGLLLVWVLNIVRIQAIFAAGVIGGEAAALDVLHPIAGLVLFNIGVFAMLGLTGRFGLSFPRVDRRPGSSVQRPLRLSTPIAAAALVALALAVVNGTYARFEPLANGLAEPRVHPFNLATAAHLSGWDSAFVARFDHGKPYFGESSVWDRVLYASESTADFATNHPVYVDVIKSDDPNALAGFGVEDCYRFHGFLIEGTADVALGQGVVAQVINYHDPRSQRDWSALWWEWPYRSTDGVWYERIVVLMPDGPRASYTGVPASNSQLPIGRFAATDAFLTAFGRELLNSQIAVGVDT